MIDTFGPNIFGFPELRKRESVMPYSHFDVEEIKIDDMLHLRN